MSESPVTDIFDKDDITFPEELEIASTRVEGRKEFKETVKKGTQKMGHFSCL